MKITEHNATTGEIIEREATEEELTQLELDAAAAESRRKIIEEREAARLSALEKLSNLGLTEEEIKSILK